MTSPISCTPRVRSYAAAELVVTVPNNDALHNVSSRLDERSGVNSHMITLR
jgi:hypothetical protein